MLSRETDYETVLHAQVNSFLAGQAGSDALRERHSKSDFSPESYKDSGGSAGLKS